MVERLAFPTFGVLKHAVGGIGRGLVAGSSEETRDSRVVAASNVSNS